MRPITPQPDPQPFPQNLRDDHRVRPARACSLSRGRSPGDAEAIPNWLICTRTRADARPRSAAQDRRSSLFFQVMGISAHVATLHRANDNDTGCADIFVMPGRSWPRYEQERIPAGQPSVTLAAAGIRVSGHRPPADLSTPVTGRGRRRSRVAGGSSSQRSWRAGPAVRRRDRHRRNTRGRAGCG